MKKWSLFILFLYIGLVLFMPKQSLWNGFLSQLHPKGVYLQTESTREHLLTLLLKKNRIFQKKRDIADIGKIEIVPLLLFNQIGAEDIVWKHITIDTFICRHFFYKPWICTFRATGKFGEIYGKADLYRHTIEAMIPSDKKLVRQLRKYGKVRKKGKGYRFVTTYK